MTIRAPLALLVLTLSASPVALELTLDLSSIEQAVHAGTSLNDQARARFHEPYRLVVGVAPVDYIDVVTPFRRIAMEADYRRRTGGRFGQREALDLAASSIARVDLVVELTFHPMNAFVGVPDYAVILQGPDGKPVHAQSLDRIPRFGPRVEGIPRPLPGTVIPRGNEPMLGGTVIAAFDGRLLDPRAEYVALIIGNGKELARARVAFAALR